jgi:hypothetical protein
MSEEVERALEWLKYRDFVCGSKETPYGPTADLIETLTRRLAEVTAERDEARAEAKDEAADFIFGVLEEALGNPTYSPCDGTETWDGDVAGTVYEILNASGLRNEDTGELATARAAAAEAALSRRDEALRVAREALWNARAALLAAFGLTAGDLPKISAAIAKIDALTKPQEAADAGENG